MTLRIMLVGLVASMGFELPSGGDFSAGPVRPGMGQREDGRPDGVLRRGRSPDSGSTGCLQAESPIRSSRSVLAESVKTSDDAAFVAVSEAMVDRFVADSMPTAETPLPVEDEPAPGSRGRRPSASPTARSWRPRRRQALRGRHAGREAPRDASEGTPSHAVSQSPPSFGVTGEAVGPG